VRHREPGLNGRVAVEFPLRHPAVPPIAFDQLPAKLAATLAPRVARLGYLGEFFQRTAHQPDVLLSFHEFTEAGKRAVGEGLTELVALTVSTELGNTYERNQHEHRSIALGRSRAWVADVERRRPAAAELLDDEERRAQTAVLAAVRDRRTAAQESLDRYATRYGAAAAIALLFVTGRYLAHGLVVRALGIQPPVPSIFEDGSGDR
jgi:alkylhydroperoxidase family enzyme